MTRAFALRVFGTMRLDAATYEGIEADPSAIEQAVVVVVAFALAAGIGMTWPSPAPAALAAAVAVSLAGWFSWAALVYYLGVHVFPGPKTRADIGELARTIGFSAAPGVFFVLLGLPVSRPLVFGVISAWMLASMVVAVRQALDFSHTARAVGVCAAGWLLAALVALVIGLAFGPVVS
jgi:hypothetical protein